VDTTRTPPTTACWSLGSTRTRRWYTPRSLFSQLAFSWLNPLLRLGRTKALDLAVINGEDSAQHASQKFAEAWSRHVNDKARGSSNSLALVLFKCFLGEIALTGFYALMRTLTTAVAPLLLFAFVWYSRQEERDLRTGLLLAGCLLLTKLVESGSSTPGGLECVSGPRWWQSSSTSSSGCQVL
jgi:hypothetical protein